MTKCWLETRSQGISIITLVESKITFHQTSAPPPTNLPKCRALAVRYRGSPGTGQHTCSTGRRCRTRTPSSSSAKVLSFQGHTTTSPLSTSWYLSLQCTLRHRTLYRSCMKELWARQHCADLGPRLCVGGGVGTLQY